MLQRNQKLAVGFICGIAVAALGLFCLFAPVGDGLKNASYDLLFAPRSFSHPTEAVVICMDEESHENLKQSLGGAWDRNLHAKLLERLTAARAKAVVFDIVFTGEGPNPGATTNFVKAIKTNGAVVLGIDVVQTATGRAGIGSGKQFIPPFEALADAAAEMGSVEVEASYDLVVREHLQKQVDDFFPGLAWAAAKLMKVPADGPQAERWLNYYGPPGIVPHCSYYRALDGNEIGDEFFSGKVVFVGARLLTKFAGERKDEYRSPYGRWQKESPFIAGVEIQATTYLNLARGDWLRRLSARAEMWAVILFGLGAGLGLVSLRPWSAVAAAFLIAIAVAAVTYLSFSRLLIWFPWIIPVGVQLPLALSIAVAFNSFRLYLENKLLEQSLGRHLAPARVKQLLKRRELLQPGAEKQMLTIMFTDIADFTKLSEGMDSGKLAELMNTYFEKAISCVHETDGCLVKLIGDALFAIWNAPTPQLDHQQRAFRTALLLQERIADFRSVPAGIPIRTRIGIHTGLADVGNFGSATRFDYTAIGENINLASRLEGLNKFLGTNVLASREAHAAVESQILTRAVGKFRLKGFEKPIEVYELIGEKALAEPTQSWRETFAEALKRFGQRDLEGAEDWFCKVLKLRPDDGPSRFYLAKIGELRQGPLPESWAGEIELTEK